MASITSSDLINEEILEFQRLYKKHFNIVLTKEEATTECVQFLQFMALIFDNNEAFRD